MSLWLTIAIGAGITTVFIALIMFRMASVTTLPSHHRSAGR